MRGPRLLVALVATALAAAGLAWLAAGRMQTPEERALAREPEQSAVAVPVEERTITDGVVTRADVALDDMREVTAPEELAGLVVTGVLVEAEDDLASGDALAELEGRPLLVLEGDLPAWRELAPGARGPDVAQLQEALADLGFYDGDVDGRYMADTADAVDDWLDAAGFDVAGTPEEVEASLEEAIEAVRSAESALADAELGVDQAKQQAEDSEKDLREARGDARRALRDAESDAERSRQLADDRVEDAKEDLAEAEQALQDAETDQEAAQAESEVADAEDRLTDAQEASAEARREATRAIENAERALEKADRSLRRHLDDDHTREAEQARADARLALEDAEDRRDVMEGQAGARLPAGEVLFLPDLPAQIHAVHARRGETLEGELVTLAGEQVVARASVPPGDAGLIDVGAEAHITEAPDAPIEGSVVSTENGDGDEGSDRVMVEVALADEARALVGDNVRLVIPDQTTGGLVMAVPLGALRTAADGSVSVRLDGHPPTDVPVDVGLRAEGFAEIRPTDDHDLSAGDYVLLADTPSEDSPDGASRDAD